jgi:hypothetical protein
MTDDDRSPGLSTMASISSSAGVPGHPPPQNDSHFGDRHTPCSVKAVAWLRARGLGCRHQVPPHLHPPVGPFDPSTCASVLHSVPELGGGRHGRQDTFVPFRGCIYGTLALALCGTGCWRGRSCASGRSRWHSVHTAPRAAPNSGHNRVPGTSSVGVSPMCWSACRSASTSLRPPLPMAAIFTTAATSTQPIERF